jgi:hypothetical protein
VRALAAALVGACLLAWVPGSATAEEGARVPGVVNLRGGKIRNVATTVSVPLTAEKSLVLALHEGFWVQCPRYLTVPTSLAGFGLIVQFLNARGGSPALLYVGSVPLAAATEGEAPAARLERAVRAFVADLNVKYGGVDFEILSGPVTVAPATIKVSGKKTSVWRTARYETRPSVPYGGPESVLVGECILFQPEGTDVLAYVALDSKSGGSTLDRAIPGLAVVETTRVNPAGRFVQLNDITEGAEGRFPVRLLSYESPAGFVVAPSVRSLLQGTVYAEDRLDAKGAVTASHRIEQDPADDAKTPAEEAAMVGASYLGKDGTPLKQVALGTPGTFAWTFSYPSEVSGRACTVRAAVFRFDDQRVTFSWFTFGDAAQAEKDAAAFDRLLAGLEMAVRW